MVAFKTSRAANGSLSGNAGKGKNWDLADDVAERENLPGLGAVDKSLLGHPTEDGVTEDGDLQG